MLLTSTCLSFPSYWIYSTLASSTATIQVVCTDTPWEGISDARKIIEWVTLTTPCKSFQASAEWVSCLLTAILAALPANLKQVQKLQYVKFLPQSTKWCSGMIST